MKRYEYHDISPRGTIERVSYTTLNENGVSVPKYANVYLPYGYDSAKEKRYNVLYLMHGGGGNPDAWLDCCKIKNMLDHTIATGEVEPLIVVFPSFYKEDAVRVGGVDRDREHSKVLGFMTELTDDLLPAVEGKYRTYTADGSQEALRASRAHRGFGGFSMGSCVTWYTFMKKCAYFAEFLPLSGDAWCVEPMGGLTHTEETAAAICAAVPKELSWHVRCATGTEDIAFAALDPMITALKAHTDTFTYSESFDQGNLNYFAEEGNVHSYEAVMDYVYNYLPYLFH